MRSMLRRVLSISESQLLLCDFSMSAFQDFSF
jgi:hypothetical protein